jgi:hypothetical protein
MTCTGTGRRYNPCNYSGNPVNIFGQIVSLNMLCLPKNWRKGWTDWIRFACQQPMDKAVALAECAAAFATALALRRAMVSLWHAVGGACVRSCRILARVLTHLHREAHWRTRASSSGQSPGSR